MPEAVVVAHELTKRYRYLAAVADLSFDVRAGELFVLLGPNGAGKTTTFKMLMGVLRPTDGTAAILGHDCFAERAEVMRHVGYVPDDPVFYDYLTGHELLQFVARMHGLDPVASRARAQELTQRLEIERDLGDFAVNFSRGMKKKLALCAALLHEPELLILDEPTSGLDPWATRALLDLVREQAAAGRTVLYSTHLLDQAQRLCDRVAIIAKGRLAAIGTLDELRAAQASGDATLEEIFFAVTGERGGDETASAT